MGEKLHFLDELPLVIAVFCVSMFITITTEFTSNVATATIVLPILSTMARKMAIHPLLLIVPGIVSCSFAFMLPVATPPNAIAFSTGRLQVRHMMR